MAGPDTKTTILDAAEALFAEQGYDAASLRELTRRAGVNLAAVNYHFGGKEKLAMAVLARTIAPINAERARRLEALPVRATTADVVRAFVEPAFPTNANCTAGHIAPARDFCRMFGRLMVDQPPFLRLFLAEQFRDLGLRFEARLRQSLPRHDAATVWWRMHFLAGAMAHTLHSADGLAHLTAGLCDATDVDAVVEQLVAFAAAGISAPPLPAAKKRRAAAPATERRARSRR
ncbi:MAG: TetR family transcriptional regulator [Planctomycetes bacterium]|jgi:AcrR family transcriptional regulator|nr:TetR family transcriptional regulator [Planctomycetota bacterium]